MVSTVTAKSSDTESRRGGTEGHREWLRLLLFFVTVLILTACRVAPDPQPLSLNPEPWPDGEVSVYRVSDRDGNPAGVMRFDLNTGQLRSGDRGWLIRREVDAGGDLEIAAVEATLGKLVPEYAMLVRTDAEGAERVATDYNGGTIDMTLTTKTNNTTYQRTSAPTDTRDERTALLMARMLPLAEGYAVQFNSYLPVADQLDRVTLTVLKREEVSVPAGVFDTWLIELDNNYTKTKAWVGAEPPYPLVKYEEGRNGALFELEMIEE